MDGVEQPYSFVCKGSTIQVTYTSLPVENPVNFLALVPLEHLAEYGGEQLEFYVGKSLGELIVITLNKYAIL